MSARQLAAELEVSQRTILRDIEALSAAGIPLYAVRGCLGGFELIDGFRSDLPVAASPRRPAPGQPAPGQPAPDARPRRARVRLSPRGRRLAALLGRPAGIRIHRSSLAAAGREGWVEAWVRIDSVDAATLDMLALGAEVEVIHPPELRAQVRRTASHIAGLHASPEDKK